MPQRNMIPLSQMFGRSLLRSTFEGGSKNAYEKKKTVRAMLYCYESRKSEKIKGEVSHTDMWPTAEERRQQRVQQDEPNAVETQTSFRSRDSRYRSCPSSFEDWQNTETKGNRSARPRRTKGRLLTSRPLPTDRRES